MDRAADRSERVVDAISLAPLVAQRIFLKLAYVGTHYHGWQTQTAKLPTVQQTLEAALAKMLGYAVNVHGCGRTDTGVHASSYYAHFDLLAPLVFDPVQRLYRILPPDIAVYEWIPVLATANAQRSATFRRYEYLVSLRQNPFQHSFRAQLVGVDLDIDAMQATVKLYREATDFRAFCRRPEQYPSTVCRIDECTLSVEEDGGLLRFTIQGNRFLHNMVRLLMQRMLDVGQGKLSVGDVAQALGSGLSPKRLRAAPAQGLSLVGVGYAFLKGGQVG